MKSTSTAIRFQGFVLETEPPALFRAGRPVELAAQPLRLLLLLASRPREVISHAEIRDHLWPDRVVAFDNGVHVCIRQIRAALGEVADSPRFVVNVPRRGYRFLPGPRARSRLRVRWVAATLLFAAMAAAIGPDSGGWRSETSSAEAQARDAVQRGRYVLESGSDDAGDRSRQFFLQAIAADPEHAPAHAALAESYVHAGRYRQAFDHARRAAALDPRLPEAHLHLGAAYALGQWDWTAAEAAIQRALALSPQSAEAHHALASVYAVTGRLDQALELMESALGLDPVSTLLRADYGFFLYYAGRLEAARQQCAAALRLEPDHHPSRICLFKVAVQAGDLAAALEQAGLIMRAWDADPALSASIQSRISMAGVEAFERWRLSVYYELAQAQPIDPMSIALIHAALGDHDDALAHLEEAARSHSPMTPFVLADPVFEAIRDQPRFRRLVTELGVRLGDS